MSNNSTGNCNVRRIAYLDSLRGIASLIVAVLWHYQHFSGLYQPGGAAVTNAPFYNFLPLKMGYKYGFVAVDLFFILSGIVFSYVYSERVAKGQVSGKKFFVFRFSRLYPLHFATLFCVAMLAGLYQSLYGTFPIYGINDGYHFMLNLFFLQKGFFDHGPSFNGPSWSMSIEAFLYILFFIYTAQRLSMVYPALGIFISLVLLGSKANFAFIFNEDMARGLGGFFVGILLYKAMQTKNWKLMLIPFALLSLTSAAFCLWHMPSDVKEYREIWFFPLCWIGFCTFIALLHYVAWMRRCLEIKPLITLGEISLAMYLTHVPLQIAMLLVMKSAGTTIPYGSVAFLLAYAVLLISLSLKVYRLEMWAQELLRNQLTKQHRPILITAVRSEA